MRLDNPIPAVAASLYSACHNDLADVVYEAVDYSDPAVRRMPLLDRPKVEMRRRPTEHDVEVFAMFAQTWPSTAMGFDRGDGLMIGGSAITPAYTVIITTRGTREFAVYFDGHFAYKVESPNKRFFEDIERRAVASVRNHAALYLTPVEPVEEGPPRWIVRWGSDKLAEQTLEFPAHDQAGAVTHFSVVVTTMQIDEEVFAAYASISLTGQSAPFNMAWTKCESVDPIEGLELVR